MRQIELGWGAVGCGSAAGGCVSGDTPAPVSAPMPSTHSSFVQICEMQAGPITCGAHFGCVGWWPCCCHHGRQLGTPAAPAASAAKAGALVWRLRAIAEQRQLTNFEFERGRRGATIHEFCVRFWVPRLWLVASAVLSNNQCAGDKFSARSCACRVPFQTTWVMPAAAPRQTVFRT